MPRYEYQEGTSSKFWEISIEGSTVVTHYGRIGTTGQKTLKKLPDAARAKKEHDRLIASKVKKGYRPAGGGAAPKKAAPKKAAPKKAAPKKAAPKKAAPKKGKGKVAAPKKAAPKKAAPKKAAPKKGKGKVAEPMGGEVPWLVGARINGIAWSPDGQRLAAVGQGQGLVFSAGGAVLARLAGTFGYAYDVAFSPDGALLAVGFHGGHLILYRADSGKQVRQLKGHGGVPSGVRKLRFSPDGKLLASVSDDRTLRIWQVQSGKLLKKHGEPADINGVDWFPDGGRVAFGTDRAVGVYDIKQGKVVAHETGCGSADVLVVDGGQRIFADGCAGSGGIFIFDAALELEDTLNQRGACRLRLGDDGALYAASWTGKDCGVWQWDPKSKKRKRLPGHEDRAVWALDLNRASGVVAAAGDHGLVHRWDQKRAPLTGAVAGHSKEIERLVLGPEGDRLYSCGDDGNIMVWELPAGLPLATYRIEGSSGTEGIALSPDHQVLYATGYSGIAAFDLKRGAPLWQKKTDRVRRVLPLDAQTLVVTWGSRLVWVDARTGKVLHRGKPVGGWSINFVERLRDGRLVTGQFLGDQEIALWDPAQREVCGALEVKMDSTHGFYDMIQLPDGRLLISGADKTVRLVDARATKQTTVHKGKESFDRIAISPKGKLLAAAADPSLTLFAFPSFEKKRQVKLPFDVRALCFVSESELLCGGKNGQIWRVHAD